MEGGGGGGGGKTGFTNYFSPAYTVFNISGGWVLARY